LFSISTVQGVCLNRKFYVAKGKDSVVARYLTTGMFSENNVRSAFASSFNLSMTRCCSNYNYANDNVVILLLLLLLLHSVTLIGKENPVTILRLRIIKHVLIRCLNYFVAALLFHYLKT